MTEADNDAQVTPELVREFGTISWSALDSFLRFLEEQITPVLQGQVNLTPREDVFAGNYYRTMNLAESMQALNGPRYFQANCLLARATVELLIDTELLSRSQDPTDVDRFHAFATVERFRAAQKAVRTFDDAGRPEAGQLINMDELRQHIRSEEERLVIDLVEKHWGTDRRGRPKWPKHWSDRSLAARARDAGTTYELLYAETYPLLSWYAHPGSTGYAGIDVSTLEGVGASAFNIARRALVEVVGILCSELKLVAAHPEMRKILETAKDLGAITAAQLLGRLPDS